MYILFPDDLPYLGRPRCVCVCVCACACACACACMWDEGVEQQAPQIMTTLPATLQVELAQEMHRQMMMKIPLFSSLSPQAIFFLVNNWTRSVYMPQDRIIREGDVINRMYIIIRGVVQVSIKTGGTRLIIAELDEGQFFGESTMLSDKLVEQKHTIIAVEFCELLYFMKSTISGIHEIGRAS